MARGQPPPEKELRHANGVMMLAPEVLPELIDALVKAKAEAVARGLLPADPHVERDVVDVEDLVGMQVEPIGAEHKRPRDRTAAERQRRYRARKRAGGQP